MQYTEQIRHTLKPSNMLLKKARFEKGWSQQEVANLAYVPQPFMISRWENGASVPNAIYRERLCAIFGKTSAELGFPETLPTLAPNVLNAHAPIYDPATPVCLSNHSDLIGRTKLLSHFKGLLCDENGIHLLALHGLPGVGKTSLAIELVYDSDIRHFFDGGILWANLSPQPDFLAHFRRWGSLFSFAEQEHTHLFEESEWRQHLRRQIGERRMLIILDDVWSLEDALKCTVGGQHCVYVLTTRIAKTAVGFAEIGAFAVPELTPEDGFRLLSRIIPSLAKTEARATHELALISGGLPLALHLLGSYLLIEARHRQSRRIRAAIEHLLLIETRFQLAYPLTDLYQDSTRTGQPVRTFKATLALSIMAVDEKARQALHALSAFPAKPNSFSEEAALAIAATNVATLDQLVDMGLMEVEEEGRYRIHQVIANYARLYLPQQKTQIEERMVHYWIDLLEHHQPVLQPCELLEREIENILVALALAYKRATPDSFVRGLLFYHHILTVEKHYKQADYLLIKAKRIIDGHHDQMKSAETLKYQEVVNVLSPLGIDIKSHHWP